jgi:hypothetical protein
MMTQRKIISAIAAALIVIAIFTVIQAIRQSGRGTLTVTTLPRDAAVMLHNKKIADNRKVGVSPGTYDITVTRSGFADQKQDVTITKGKESTVAFYLSPNGAEGLQWFKDHPDEAHEAEAVTGEAFTKASEKKAEELPLINDLPFIDQQYRVDYGKSEKDPSKIAIYIKYWSDEGKTQALDWIRFKGYDPNKLEIIYTKATEAFN